MGAPADVKSSHEWGKADQRSRIPFAIAGIVVSALVSIFGPRLEEFVLEGVQIGEAG